MAVSAILLLLNYDLTQINEMGNIDDIAAIFSPISMLIILAFQPIGEEIFFRGFLLNKTAAIIREKTRLKENTAAVNSIAILITAIIFGIAHLSYGKLYPVAMTIVLGLILGFVVVKTKNLFSSILAHVLFNLTSFIIYFYYTQTM